jgi:hypothetical protein
MQVVSSSTAEVDAAAAVVRGPIVVKCVDAFSVRCIIPMRTGKKVATREEYYCSHACSRDDAASRHGNQWQISFGKRALYTNISEVIVIKEQITAAATISSVVVRSSAAVACYRAHCCKLLHRITQRGRAGA